MKFKYGLIDLSWITSRNTHSIASRTDNFNSLDVVKMTVQSLNRFTRDLGLQVEGMILLKDTPSEAGYHRTSIIRESGGNEYKGDRLVSPQIYQIKSEAIEILSNELSNLGVPTISVPGFEFDDLATIISHTQSGPNVIVTKDSDLIYSTSPNCYLWQPPLSGKPARLITYQEAYDEYLPDSFKGVLGLYEYFSMQQATGAKGHNGMTRTIKARVKVDGVIKEILSGNYDKVTNIELYNAQKSTFDLPKLPGYGDAIQAIESCQPGLVKGSVSEFYRRLGIVSNYFINRKI